MNEIIKRMNAIKARRLEIRGILENGTDADLNALETELRNLDTEMTALEERKRLLEGIGDGSVPTSSVPNPTANQTRSEEDHNRLYRSAWLKTLLGRSLTDAEQRAYTEELEQRAYSTGSSSAAAAIPQEVADSIIKKMYEVAPILARCKIFHVPGNFKFAFEGTRTDAALHTENASITGASDSLKSVSLTGYEITKLVKASRATLAMSIPAFEAYIVEIIAEDLARKIENYIFTGTGSEQPGGVGQGGKGASGAYTADTDLVEVAAANDLAEADLTKVYGMLGSGYERNALWTMSKNTFFAYVYALMNKSKNNLIEFANGKYYIMGCEVYFTGSLSKGVIYLGDFQYIVGNYSQDITVVRSEHSGLATNSVDYLGACVFDSKAVPGLGAFVKLVKKQS